MLPKCPTPGLTCSAPCDRTGAHLFGDYTTKYLSDRKEKFAIRYKNGARSGASFSIAGIYYPPLGIHIPHLMPKQKTGRS
jgi:hypothetical protein